MLPIEWCTMNTPEEIGTRIRTARRAAQLTQEQLAELAGTSTRTVRDIEKGTGSASLAVVARIAETLGLNIVVTQ